MFELDATLVLVLALVALMAGFFDAIAGGGGLITLPVLFIAGIEPLARLLPTSSRRHQQQFRLHSPSLGKA